MQVFIVARYNHHEDETIEAVYATFESAKNHIEERITAQKIAEFEVKGTKTDLCWNCPRSDHDYYLYTRDVHQ